MLPGQQQASGSKGTRDYLTPKNVALIVEGDNMICSGGMQPLPTQGNPAKEPGNHILLPQVGLWG